MLDTILGEEGGDSEVNFIHLIKILFRIPQLNHKEMKVKVITHNDMGL